MPAALQAALTVVAWIAVVLLLTGGFWFLRRHHLLHAALAVILALAGIFLLIRVHELVLMIVIAAALAFILDNLVERLARIMPRPVAIGIVYLMLVVVLVLVAVWVIPHIVRQAHLFLVNGLPAYVQWAKEYSERLTRRFGLDPEQVQSMIQRAIEQLQAGSRGITIHVEQGLLAVFGWTVRGVLILIMSIYLLLDKRNLHAQFLRLFSDERRPEAEATRAELSVTFSRYLRGQLTVILFVAVAVTVALLLFRIPYAFFIGFLAGVLEIIPYFGAIAGAIPAVILGFTHSTGVGIALIVFFIALNQIEGHVVIPLVMGGHLEMRPLTILLSLIAGEMLLGIPGMIIAVPLVSSIRVLIPHFTRHYRRLQVRETRQREAAAAPGAGERSSG